MAELEQACCAPEALASCCEASDKVDCCDPPHGPGCGCRAGQTPARTDSQAHAASAIARASAPAE